MFEYIILYFNSKIDPDTILAPSETASPLVSTTPSSEEQSVSSDSSDLADDFLLESGHFFSEDELDPAQSSDPMIDEDLPIRSPFPNRYCYQLAFILF